MNNQIFNTDAYDLGWGLAIARFAPRGYGRSTWWSAYLAIKSRGLIRFPNRRKEERQSVAWSVRLGYQDSKSSLVTRAVGPAPF
jgi:hypothetical protein